MATLAEMLRGYADKITNLPTEATKFLAGPTSFLDAVTGKMNMPEEKGFSQGFFGVEPDKNLTVLDPNNVKYMEGYDTGEPFGYAAVASPFVAAGANKLSNKAVQAITKNPFATDIGVIDYASKFSPVKMAQELKKNDLNFFSTLDEAVGNLQQPKGTGQQYMAQLLKTPAVKQEELIYRGLDKFLEQNPKVSKQQIQDYLETNPVKLKETVLDDGYTGKQRTDLVDDYRLRDGDVIDDYDYIDSRTDDYLMDFKEDLAVRQEVMDDILAKNADDFADYSINPSTAERLEREVDDALYERAQAQARDEYYSDPYMRYYDDYNGEITGNESVGYYVTIDGRNITPNRGIYSLSDAEDLLRERHVEQGNLQYEPEGGPKYADYQTDGPSKNYREVLIQLDPTTPKAAPVQHPTMEGKYTLADVGTGKKYVLGADGQPIVYDTKEAAAASPLFQNYRNQVEPQNYQSGHFDEENILAHMRVNDRMIDGKKSLFIEEIQSDWHQQGRKKGYKTTNRSVNQIDKDLDNVVNELRAKPNVSYAPTEADWARYPELTAKHDALSAERANATSINSVPDAPYKKNWQEMAVRRAIQMAVDEGYDRVAFTTGKQQAERYNLAKYVETVIYDPELQKLIAWDKNSQRVIDKAVPKDQLEDYIGKEAARKIEEAKPNQRGEKVLNNADLQIGGEGMKGFYDKILPEYINKYGKKYGIKVGKTKIDQSFRQDLSDDELLIGLDKLGMTYDDFKKLKIDDRSKLYEKVSREVYPKTGNEVHYFDITPEAKKSLLEKGSPLFAIPPAAAMTDEESRKEMLERLFQEQQK